jgi:hypothetical protein
VEPDNQSFEDTEMSMGWIARAAAALGLAVAGPAAAGPYSDLWWNPRESGWGMNVVQQQETAFVTLFVYGPDGAPVWYVAPAARVYAYGAGGLPQFKGALHRTRGPWHGGPFDPSRVQSAVVGEVDLEVLGKDRIRVHYSAEGATVVKEVVRQTWEEPMIGAHYVSQFVLRQAFAPGGPPFGTRDYQADVLVHFEGGEGFMRVIDHLDRVCHYRGPYETTGKLLRFSGAYECGSGDGRAGTFELSELEFTANGVTGYLRTFAADVNQYGRFAAVLR